MGFLPPLGGGGCQSDSVVVNSSFEIVDTVTIGANKGFNVDPSSITVPQGTKVKFIWDINGVKLTVKQKPEASNWKGVDSLRSSGFEHTHTFDSKGTYKYECDPHNNVMRGTITVI